MTTVLTSSQENNNTDVKVECDNVVGAPVPPASRTVAPRTKSPQSKRWCYTLNNPVQPIPWNELTQEYHVYGEEVGESGTKHYQGYVCFKTAKRLTQLKELNCNAHWEPARGNNQQAADYCKKDGKVVEFGTLPLDKHVKGSRAGNKANSDKWRAISDHAKSGNLSWIDENYPKPFVQGYRNLVAIKKDFTKRLPDLPDVCGIWYHGEAGVGKTTLITKLYPEAYLKRLNKWFDGYNHEEVVVVDDIDDTHSFMGYELKKLGDKFCYMVEVKNASQYIRPKRCAVTSQYTIDEIWSKDPKTAAALKRRFKEVLVTKDNIKLLMACEDNIALPLESEELLSPDSDTLVVDYSDDELDFDEDALAEIAALEMEYAKKKKYELEAKALDKKLEKQKREFNKLPPRLRPQNEFFPPSPIRFSWRNKRKRAQDNKEFIKRKLMKLNEKKRKIVPTTSFSSDDDIELQSSLHDVYSVSSDEEDVQEELD